MIEIAIWISNHICLYIFALYFLEMPPLNGDGGISKVNLDMFRASNEFARKMLTKFSSILVLSHILTPFYNWT